ncbi:hypothetical protein [Paenibacillus ehimensis]|uniref:Uncharacterized protein n=1 Tax=Paenibacillus ehimensis TaxID=79264 RepID=A0ABT8VE35_9BACL|nr:hypothetical protein [Paenibacillus ehimensis]MDO3679250.1 hypothetical protein [Paenibacillus ehimensis]MEC0213366.1 hypothetical protein [Paenibacillus ehimensis]
MLYAALALLAVLLVAGVLKRLGAKTVYSTALLLSVLLSLVANLGLGQNYFYNLIPGIHDGGLGISNQVAYLIIGEDLWMQARFRIAFERSVWITLLLIIAYAVAKIAESKTERSKAPSRLT